MKGSILSQIRISVAISETHYIMTPYQYSLCIITEFPYFTHHSPCNHDHFLVHLTHSIIYQHLAYRNYNHWIIIKYCSVVHCFVVILLLTKQLFWTSYYLSIHWKSLASNGSWGTCYSDQGYLCFPSDAADDCMTIFFRYATTTSSPIFSSSSCIIFV